MTDETKFSGCLFSNPRHFNLNYSINPYMKEGNIDTEKAYEQWSHTVRSMRQKADVATVNYDTFEPVKTSTPNLPDIVFCANQGLSVPGSGYILANMNNEERKAETDYFKMWAEHKGYEVRELEDDITFEGEGDAKWHPKRDILWMGYGYRTDESAVDRIDSMIDAEVKSLELKSQYFYHLDVCFEPLDSETALVVREAFDETGMEKIRSEFSTVLEVPDSDIRTMGGNCARMDLNSVLIDRRNSQTADMLQNNGYEVHTVNTGEYMKSGGSVDCMFIRIPQISTY